MKKKIVFYFLLILILLLAVSCKNKSIDYIDSDITNLEHPDIIFEGVNYTLGETGIFPVYINAKSIEIYNAEKTTKLIEIKFIQKNQDGEIIMTGSCDQANITNDTKAALLEGNVNLDRTVEKMNIKAEEINFDYENQRITTDKSVILKYNDSNVIDAVGLSCDFINSIYEFDKINQGTIVL